MIEYMKFTGPPCNGQKVSDKKTDMTFELPDKNNRVYIVSADSYFGAHFAKYWLENGIEFMDAVARTICLTSCGK